MNAHADRCVPKMLLLGAQRWRRESVVFEAAAAGFTPALVLHGDEPLPAQLAEAVDPRLVYRIPSHRPFPIMDIARKLSATRRDWYVVGLDDYECKTAAELSRFSALQTMSLGAPMLVLEKHRLRKRWNELCIENPILYCVPFCVLTFADATFADPIARECDDILAEDEPLIVKPDALDASIGLRTVRSQAGVDDAVRSIATELSGLVPEAAAIGISVIPRILVERRIPRSTALHVGAEFSAEVLSTPALGSTTHTLVNITEKRIDPTTFVEVGHCVPARFFPPGLVPHLERATTDLLDGMGVRCCISHWEYIVTPDNRLALVEAQLRPAGDRIMDLVRIAHGRSMYDALFSSMLGADGSCGSWAPPTKTAAVFFPRPERSVTGSLAIVVDDSVRMPPGTTVYIDDGIRSAEAWDVTARWDSRFVTVVSEGSDFDAARRACEDALNAIEVIVTTRSGATETLRLVLP